MEKFSYIDIFSTKGIEYVLVLGFLAVFIIFLRFLNKTRQSKVAASGVNQGLEGSFMPQKEGRFYSEGHGCSSLKDSGNFEVGISEFLHSLIGDVDFVELPAEGAKVERGTPLFALHSDSRRIDIPSPVTGEVLSVNKHMEEDPELLSKGNNFWLVNVKPDDLSAELAHLSVNSHARTWISSEISRLRDFFSSLHGNDDMAAETLLDGGMPVKGALQSMNADVWKRFNTEFINESKNKE